MTKRRCQWCGAIEGSTYADYGYRHIRVKIRRDPRTKRVECQLCVRGMRELRREARAKRPAS